MHKPQVASRGSGAAVVATGESHWGSDLSPGAVTVLDQGRPLEGLVAAKRMCPSISALGSAGALLDVGERVAEEVRRRLAERMARRL